MPGKKTSPAQLRAQAKYQKKPSEVKKRVKRNKARRHAIKDGRVKKGDGKDIDHKKPLRSGGSNSKSNTRVRSRSANRSDNGNKRNRTKKK